LVDVIGLQSFQTGFQCLHHALAAIPAALGSLPGAALEYFVARTTLLAMSLDELTQEFLLRFQDKTDFALELAKVYAVGCSECWGRLDQK
jgi:hypothetical protein